MTASRPTYADAAAARRALVDHPPVYGAEARERDSLRQHAGQVAALHDERQGVATRLQAAITQGSDDAVKTLTARLAGIDAELARLGQNVGAPNATPSGKATR